MAQHLKISAGNTDYNLRWFKRGYFSFNIPNEFFIIRLIESCSGLNLINAGVSRIKNGNSGYPESPRIIELRMDLQLAIFSETLCVFYDPAIMNATQLISIPIEESIVAVTDNRTV